MNQHTRITVTILTGAVVATLLGGCSGSSTGSAATEGATTGSTSATASASPSPRQTQSGVASAGAAPTGGGDFCSTQGAWLDYAYTYDISDPDQAKAKTYMDLAKRTNDLAPAAIKQDTLITVALATAAVEGPTGVTSPVQVDPQTPERITAAAGAVKDWTKAHCSAEIAAKWDRPVN